MALTKGTSGRGTLDSATEELAYDSRDSLTVEPDYPCKAMRVQCTRASIGCFVRVPSLMGDDSKVAVGAGVYLPPLDQGNGNGNSQVFSGSKIEQVFISGDGAASSVAWGPV